MEKSLPAAGRLYARHWEPMEGARAELYGFLDTIKQRVEDGLREMGQQPDVSFGEPWGNRWWTAAVVYMHRGEKLFWIGYGDVRTNSRTSGPLAAWVRVQATSKEVQGRVSRIASELWKETKESIRGVGEVNILDIKELDLDPTSADASANILLEEIRKLLAGAKQLCDRLEAENL